MNSRIVDGVDTSSTSILWSSVDSRANVSHSLQFVGTSGEWSPQRIAPRRPGPHHRHGSHGRLFLKHLPRLACKTPPVPSRRVGVGDEHVHQYRRGPAVRMEHRSAYSHTGVRARAGERRKEECDNGSEGGRAGCSSGEEACRDEDANLCGKRKQVALPPAFAGCRWVVTSPSWVLTLMEPGCGEKVAALFAKPCI